MPDNIGPMSSWKPIVFICLGLFVLGAIAAVIVVSLITLYLKPKGDDLAVDNTSNEKNTLNMIFATDLKDASNYLVLDPNSFAEQINQYLNSPLYKLLVQSFSFVHSSGSINTGVNQRKKRQQRASISCSAEAVEKNQTGNNGDKLDAVFYIDKNRTNMCKHGFCTPQQLSIIKRKIESKLASKSFVFNAKLDDGTAIPITTVFCSFGTVLSCQDSIQNRDETDIDCGGKTCPSCADLKNCIVSSDCVSEVCTSGICQVPTCHDNVKNGNETDVDCGGGACASCADLKHCSVVSDCISGVCTSSICQIPNINWLINGNAETGPCELSSGITSPTGWNYSGLISQIYYSNTYGDLSYTTPGPSDRGNCYFYGEQSAVTSMWQTVNMAPSITPSLIDAQIIQFNFSAWIGGYQSQDDNAQASLIFADQNNQPTGNTVILGPVLAVDRGSITSLVFRQANGFIPIGARSFTVTVTMTRVSGTDNDALIDNIAVFLHQ